MKKVWAFVLLFALCLSLAACNGGSGTSSTDASQSTAPAGSSESQSEPAPEPAYKPMFLTGYEQTAEYNPNRRILAVMVNNIMDCRPQRGIGDADVMIEIVTEGGITRLCCLYQDYTKVPTIGPVRSARDQFFQLLYAWQPLYVHVGASIPCENMMNLYDYSDYDLNGKYLTPLIYRDQARLNAGYALEHTAYTDAEHISDTIDTYGLNEKRTYNSPIFNFVNYSEPARTLTDGSANAIHVVYTPNSWYYSDFEYDAASGKYLKSQSGKKHIDENTGEQISFDNVIICFDDISLYADSPLAKVDYTTGGVAYYFYGGNYERIFWEKGSVENAIRFVYALGDDSEENQVKINCGKTYLGVTGYINYDTFQIAASSDQIDTGKVTVEIGSDSELKD